MALQFSTALRDAQNDAITAAVGAAGFLEIFDGALPATCATPSAGTKLSKHTLGSPFAPASSGGVLSPTVPADVNALAAGTAGYWRVFASDDTTCVVQGTVSVTSGDLVLSTLTVLLGEPVHILSWAWTAGNA